MVACGIEHPVGAEDFAVAITTVGGERDGEDQWCRWPRPWRLPRPRFRNLSANSPASAFLIVAPSLSEGLDDGQLVGDAGHATHPLDALERAVALVLEVDLALQRDPAVLDLDDEVVGRDVRIPDEPLQGGALDRGVLAPVVVQKAHVQFVEDVEDAARPA